MTGGISGFGATLTGSISGVIARIRKIGISGQSVTDVDVSSNDSTGAWKEFVAGMKDAGELALDLIYEKANADTIQGILGGSSEDWTILLPDGSTFVCEGYLKAFGTEIPMDGEVSQTATLKLSGAPTFTAAS